MISLLHRFTPHQSSLDKTVDCQGKHTRKARFDCGLHTDNYSYFNAAVGSRREARRADEWR